MNFESQRIEKQTVKNSIYTFLLEKREETALSYASAAADSRLINPAEALEFPVKPVTVYDGPVLVP